MAASGRSNFIANASCCAVPSRACGWPSMFASAISSASRCAASTMNRCWCCCTAIPRSPFRSASARTRKRSPTAWQMWSELFSLPQLQDEAREPAPRRRRRNAIRVRRPKFLMRRRDRRPAQSGQQLSRRARDHRDGIEAGFRRVGKGAHSGAHHSQDALGKVVGTALRALPTLPVRIKQPASPHRSAAPRTATAPHRGST